MRRNFAYLLIAAVLILPTTASGQTNPCDPTFTTCSARCPTSGWGIQVEVYADSFDCFRFYRKYCGENQWTLIYEGPNNSICGM
jgi:hypothetical protein